ncbi:penicillin acylase family protein [Ectobacillus ponti]|uniref:Penicillin acylase family protein n=1 Tax=Ectobacillus ponti TaxID=2961894 RepID=A0AA41X895_9BACI|nr:penicillin acylase family protein [Ectobacillus ponti]MCP8968123.1 penicillin acylase family protein [Ectobacillus ponti]
MEGEVIVRERPRKRRLLRFLSITAACIVLLLGSAYAGGRAYLKRSLPDISGETHVMGLQGAVTVTRDGRGVPHIEAQSEQDLYMAQGYVTAQDRLFQMDLSRRQASGRLSEVVGKKAIERDKFFRAFGLRRAAEASYGIYSEQAKKVLQWYADGVNRYIEEARTGNRLPFEFTLLGYEPEAWTPIDSLTIGKYMAYDLGGHWQGQAFRYQLLQTVPQEKAADLFPSYPKDGAVIMAALGNTNLNVKSLAAAPIPNEFNGSNNWVVSGEKTKSGKPLLADDPHLSLATPSIWYQSHLQAPGINVSGVIFAGIPGIILGHNENIAWGVTNVGPDVQDLYIEKRNPENARQFLYQNQWEQAQVIAERIRVKDQDPVDYEVVITRHGPIISEFAKDKSADTALALKWTAAEASTELEAVLLMNKAKDWDSFKQALTYFHTPAQNFVFASKDGTIAYRANGKIPIRSKGDSLLPVPGWTGEYEWSGYIPWEELPTLVNPKEGFISTANNKVIAEYPYHITHTWAQPYRAARIQEVLRDKSALTVKDMQQLQMDQKNLQAKEFVPIFLQHVQKEKLTAIEKEALARLEKWDFVDGRNEGAPLVFHMWMNEISNVLFAKELSADMLKLFEGKGQVVDELIRKAHSGNPGPWMKDSGGLDAVVTKGLQQAVGGIVKQQGEKVADWKWGTFHRLSFVHPLSAVGPLSYLFNPETPIPAGGSRVTVQAAGYGEDGIVNHGASWRFVIDMSDTTTGYHVVGPGQSGHVESAWYHDQMKEWVNGTYHETKLTKPSGKVLKLIPAAGK